MSPFDTVTFLARERQHDALESARNSARLRQARDPLFNHYHYWPASRAYGQQEATLEDERTWHLLRRPAARPAGWLIRLAGAIQRALAARFGRDGNPDVVGAAAVRYARRSS